MELDKGKFSLAAGGTMAIVYAVCAIFVVFFPDFAIRLLGWLVHLVNVEKFAGDAAITFGGFIAGLIQAFAYTYASAWIFAWLHNRFMKPAAK